MQINMGVYDLAGASGNADLTGRRPSRPLSHITFTYNELRAELYINQRLTHPHAHKAQDLHLDTDT